MSPRTSSTAELGQVRRIGAAAEQEAVERRRPARRAAPAHGTDWSRETPPRRSPAPCGPLQSMLTSLQRHAASVLCAATWPKLCRRSSGGAARSRPADRRRRRPVGTALRMISLNPNSSISTPGHHLERRSAPAPAVDAGRDVAKAQRGDGGNAVIQRIDEADPRRLAHAATNCGSGVVRSAMRYRQANTTTSSA